MDARLRSLSKLRNSAKMNSTTIAALDLVSLARRKSPTRSIFNMNDIQTLLCYAERFLEKVRGNITLDEFSIYLRNLKIDASTLSNPAAKERLFQLIGSLDVCLYVLRKDPDMKESVVLTAVERVVNSIRSEIRISA
jgi:hypothetical protein